MSSVKGRLLASFGANSLGRLFTTLIQVISVPLYLKHWGIHLYGEWILLSTIPSYLGLSDIGFGSVAGNEMTMLMAKQRTEEALEVFQSIWLLTTGASLFVATLLAVCIWFAPLDRWMHLHSMTRIEARYVVLFLGLSALLSLQETLFQGAFRCVGRYAYGTTMKHLLMLGSFGVIIIPLILGSAPPVVAVTYLVANAAGTLVLWFLLRNKVTWIRFGVRHARWRAVRRLALPAVSIMSVPLSNLLSLQGILVIVGHVLGPVAVVTFNTARTVSRSAAQAMQLINNAVWPEFSAAFGAENMALARKLHRRACQLSISLCLFVILIIAIFGRYVWSAWTIGKVPTDGILLDILLVQLLVSSLWYTSSVVPLSTNNHKDMAKVLLISSILSLALSWGLMRLPWLGLRGAAIGLVLGDLINAVYIVRASLKLLDERLPDFLSGIVQIPKLRNSKPAVYPKPTG